MRSQYFGKKECSEHLHLKCRSCERLIHLDKKSSQAIIDCLNIGGSFTLDTKAQFAKLEEQYKRERLAAKWNGRLF